jgi:hypothetical protein
MQQALEELEYLTLTPVRRAPRKPKRPSRDKLARALARRQELDTRDNCDLAPAANPAVRVEKTLAARSAADKIRDGGTRSARHRQPLAAPHTRQPAHRERARPSWFRRLIAPLVRIAKAARIT